MNRKTLAVLVASATIATFGLTACSGGGGGTSPTSTASGGAAAGGCTNEIKKPGVPQVAVWAWYPDFQPVVDLFNEAHSDVQICWNNTGQGGDEYAKFTTAIQAGTGAPDVIMLEFEVLPTFEMQKGLVDISQYGAADQQSKYTEGAWKDVTNGSAIYAIPVDSGPVAMMYRKDIFDKYKVTVPTTWDEFATAAQQLKDAGFTGQIADFPPNGTAWPISLFAQTGTAVYGYDPATTSVTINFDNDAVKKVLTYWQGLIQKGLVAADDANTTDWTTKTVNGTYATYPGAAWASGYLKGAENASADAQWQYAPIPQWDASNPVQINQGGSSFAVTTQAKDPKLATEVAEGIYDSEAAWKIGVEQAALFPTYKSTLTADWYTSRADTFFANQKIGDVLIPAASGYKGYQFSPFQTYAYDQQAQAWAKIVKGADVSSTVSDLQNTLVTYAKQQGFTVSEG